MKNVDNITALKKLLHIDKKDPTKYDVEKQIYSMSGGKCWVDTLDNSGIMIGCFHDSTFKRRIQSFNYPFNPNNLLNYLDIIKRNKSLKNYSNYFYLGFKNGKKIYEKSI
jgi:hypothetical protein